MIEEAEVAGWRALVLANELVRVTVLPEKGADICSLVDVPSGTELLFQAPWGLAPPGSAPREGSDGQEFLANYEGGWQELFPSANDACTVGGAPMPFHGEVATLPWEAAVEDEALRLSVRCRRVPFRLDRSMRLEGSSLVVDETVTNESDSVASFVWGHHCVLGPPFLEPGCRLETSARTIVTVPQAWEETSRLEPGQTSAWPHARLWAGGTVDLREVPGPEAGSHDDVYATDLDGGWAEVANPHLGLAFRLHWDAAIFRWLVVWQPYGGAHAMPLTGTYALGIEPWVSRLDLERAVEASEALELAGGAACSTSLRASIARRS